MRSAFAAALALAVAAPLAAQAKPAPSAPVDSVVLRFAWPIGLEAEMQYTQVIDREGDAAEPTHIEIEGQYTMHVHDHAQGLLVEFLDPVAVRYRASPELPPDDPRRVVYSTLGVPIPDYIVSKTDGRLLGVQGLDALHQAIAEIVQRQAPGSDVDRVLGQLADPDQLLNAAKERWTNQVTDWVGAVLRAGEVGGGEGREANPILPALSVPYQFEFKLNGIEPCAAPAGQCVRVEVSQFYDAEALNKTMNDALGQMGITNFSFDGLVEESRMILLTDPTTLLTYQMDMTKGVEGILKQDGQSRAFRRTDQLSLDFEYTKR